MRPDRDRVLQEIIFFNTPEVRGVSKTLIADMNDIVDKWGLVGTAKQVVEFRSGDLGDGLRLMVSKSVDPTKRVLIVSPGDMALNNLVLMETNLFNIVWNSALTAKDAKEAVRRIDDKFASMGLVNLRTNERIAIPPEQSVQTPTTVHRSVSEMFTHGGVIFITKIDGRTEKQILAEFDEPDKLEVLFNPEDGNAFVKLKII